MSFGGGGYNVGRTRMGTKIYLNLYDLSPANEYLFPLGLGLHHSGVEILGVEYCFADQAGVFASPQTKEAPGAIFRQQIEMGVFEGTQADIQRAIDDLKASTFGPNDYHIVRRNCNHFANALIWKLVGKQIPAHVNRIADVGSCCDCLLPPAMLQNAPVNDASENNNTNDNSSMFQPLMKQAPTANSMQAFSGRGNTLGASSATTSSSSTAGSSSSSSSFFGAFGSGSSTTTTTTTTSSSSKNGKDDLIDRREKARKAALARLEANQRQQQDKDN